MRKLKTKGFLALTTVLLAFTPILGSTVSASPKKGTTIEEVLDSNQTRAKKLLEQYDKQTKEVRKKASEVSDLKIKIDDNAKLLKTANSDLEKEKTNLKNSEKDLVDLKKEMKIVQADIDKKRDSYGKRLRTVQTTQSDSMTMVETLLESKSIVDAFARAYNFNLLQKAEAKALNDLKDKAEKQKELGFKVERKLEKIVSAKETLEEQTKNIAKTQSELVIQEKQYKVALTEQKADVGKSKKELDGLQEAIVKLSIDIDKLLKEDRVKNNKTLKKDLEDLSKKIDEYITITPDEMDLAIKYDKLKTQEEMEKYIAKEGAKMREEAEKVAKENKDSDKYSDLSGDKELTEKELETQLTQTTMAQIKLVKTAQKYLGVPYVWGGTSATGLDCSGFTQRVFKEALGIDITRVTQTQQNIGKEVALEDIQVGDLVFWGEPSYHVAIYVGDGWYIHAPQPNEKVSYSKYAMNDTSHIRRVLPDVKKAVIKE